MSSGSVLEVCVVDRLHPEPDNRTGVTAIDKRPVPGATAVRVLGLEGDQVGDVDHHGGRDKAVYAYADEDAAGWAAALGRDVPAGLFGENLRTRGVEVTDAVLGEVWQVGEVGRGPRLQVCQPRIPCMTFQRRMAEERWVRRFTEHGAPGAYLRVLEEGVVAAGDAVEVVSRPPHGVTVGDWFSRPSPALAHRLLRAEADGELELGDDLRAYVERQAKHVEPPEPAGARA